jgi:hypothetical protein
MGSYENIVKIEEMRRRLEESDSVSALKILDTMDIKKIKNTADLNIFAEVLTENERYDEAVELYLKIYDKTKTRKSLYQLIDVSIKRNNSEDANYYLMQYQKVAPKDFYKDVFRYKIDKMNGESYEQLIETLKTIKKMEYTEKWAYELAKLYYKAGMEEECIRECSDIVLWFGEGAFVEKAKMLRSYYSGETNKDTMMEELKRRSKEISNKGEFEDRTFDFEPSPRSDSESKDITYASEEEVYSASDFMVEEETEGFVDQLKKGVQDILTEGWEDEPVYEEEEYPVERDYPVELDYHENEEPNILSEEESNLLSGEEESNLLPEKDEVETNTELSDFAENDLIEDRTDKTKSELAEQEVEDTIYQLLQEEDMDEEDKKLNQLAEELQINPDEIFGNFLHVKSIKKQIVKSLESILDDHTKTVHMIITGTVGSGKTTLAKDISLFLNKVGKLKSSKVAKIKAEKLNTVDIMSKKETLKDCCLIVENASELKRGTIDSLLELSQHLQGNIAIVFEENKKNMNKLFRECPKLMDLFKNRIHLPGYTQEDLVGFAYACLGQQEYYLNPKSEAILMNKINQIAKQSESYKHLEQIYDLMQSAMDAADIRTGKQLSNLAAQGRLKDVENLSVLPEDFKIKL